MAKEVAVRPIRVLVVDDSDALLRAVVRVLRRYFYVITATNAQEALAELSSQPFDVILTDHNMPPGHNGLWLLSEVARTYPDIRRFLMSTPDPIPGLDEALANAIVQRFFAKPVDFAELINAIDQ